MDGLGVAANVIAVVDMAAKIAAQCYDYGQEVRNAKADIDRVKKEVTNLTAIAKSVQSLLSGPNGDRLATSHQLQTAIGDALDQLKRVDEKMTLKKGQKTMSRLGLRALKWPFEKSEVEGIVGDLRNCGQNMNSALQVDQTAEILDTGAAVRRTEQKVYDIDQKIVLSRLPVAEGACFGSHTEDHELTCLPNTRVDLLQQIQDWVKNPDGARVFWLNGMAGTGKSTISRTVAQRLDDDMMLGASFFFKTGEAERSTLSKFFSTIAADMAIKVPKFSTAVQEALDKDADFRKRAPGQQLKNLVIEPLMKSQKHRPDHPIVLIVDALDECERDQDIDLLINLFTDSSVMKMSQLKIFITSRPEIPNRRAFGKATAGSYHPVILHELPEPVIEHDISVFLDYRLHKIRTEWNCIVASDDRRLPSDWPGQDRRRQLVEMAVPLFIFATTMCRFIADAKFGNPDDQIQDVLAYGETGTKSRLDSTYLPILNKLVVGMDADDRSKVIEKFKSIVGSIIILETPLSTESLSRLLDVPRNRIDDHLMMLHSVLSIPISSHSPVRMLHLSFRDFLTDIKNKEATAFWIDEKLTHADIASRALTLLDRELRQNMCNLSGWGTERSSIKVETINSFLPPEVQYSCSYWVRHIQHAGDMLVDGGLVHKFFQTHFLHWLECLGLLGGAYVCIGYVEALQMLIDPQDGKELSLMLDDALSFVRANASVIDNTPLQLYSSLLIFAPMKSYLRNVYEKVISEWITFQPEVDVDWGQSLHTLECGTGFISFSHDSKLVVSPDGDTVRIWDVDTGQCIWILEGHERKVIMTVFSDDSARVLSTSSDLSVRVWSVSTGECIRMIKDHTEEVIHGFGSSISTFFVSPNSDIQVKILKAEMGELIHQLDAKSGEDRVSWAALSSNAKFAVHAYYDGKVRLWNLDDGSNVLLLTDLGAYVQRHALAFSHDSALFAYSSRPNKTIRIFRTNSGECVRELEHTKLISSVVISHDSVLLAATNKDDIWIWNLETGKCVQVLTGHGNTIGYIAFSFDSALLASSSYDETIRIWRIYGSHDQHISDQTESRDMVTSAGFSPDSALIATSDSLSSRIWDTRTGECKRVFTSTFTALSQDWLLVLVHAVPCASPQILRLDTGAPVQTLHGYFPIIIDDAGFSPDSSLVVIVMRQNDANTECTTGVWLTETGQCTQILEAGSWHMLAFFSPNGQLVATSTQSDISLWNTSDWRRMQKFGLGNKSTMSPVNMKFSPDSTLFVSHLENILEVWHCDSGICILKSNHQGYNMGCAFSSDSKFIAINLNFDNRDNDQIQLWCMETSQHLYSIRFGLAPRLDKGFTYGELVRFMPNDSGLETSHGVIALSNFPPSHWNNAPVSSSFSGCGLSPDQIWITWDGDRVLRVPSQYRPRCSAVRLDTVVLGSVSGRVTILRFATAPPETVPKSPIQAS